MRENNYVKHPHPLPATKIGVEKDLIYPRR